MAVPKGAYAKICPQIRSRNPCAVCPVKAYGIYRYRLACPQPVTDRGAPQHLDALQRLGARIHTEGRVAVVTGVEVLHGAPTVATDLRGGAALMIAALSAEGETDILDSGHVERGYESFDERLAALGADIRLSEQ